MPRGGLNKTPPRLRILAGTGRGDRQREAPKPLPVAPKCPSWLSRGAKREWRRVGPELERLGLLTRLDSAAFALFCQALADVERITSIINGEGDVIAGHRGIERKHPLLPRLAQTQEVVRRFAVEFGMTPASRSRLSFSPPLEETECPKCGLPNGLETGLCGCG